MTDLLPKIATLAENDPEIAVVWLYGSRAKGCAHASSDYDLAVAFNRFIKDDPVEAAASRVFGAGLAADFGVT